MFTRRELLQRSAVTAAGLYLLHPGSLPALPPFTGWTDADYWQFADRMQPLLEPAWDAARGAYFPRGNAGQTSHNSSLLYTHAAAARAGRTGPCRQDERARQLVRRLCASPPWRPNLPQSEGGCPSAQPDAAPRLPARTDQTHACGWGASLNG